MDEFNKIARQSSRNDYNIALKLIESWYKWIKNNADVNNQIYDLLLRTLTGATVRLFYSKESKILEQKYTPDALSLGSYNHIMNNATFEQINEVRNSLCIFVQDMSDYEKNNKEIPLFKIVKSRLCAFANNQLRVYILKDDSVYDSQKISNCCKKKYEIEHGELKIHDGSK